MEELKNAACKTVSCPCIKVEAPTARFPVVDIELPTNIGPLVEIEEAVCNPPYTKTFCVLM